MSYKSEEVRVKGVLASLRPIDPPLGHTRAKWDASTTADLTEVVKKVGRHYFFPNSILIQTNYRRRKILETIESAIQCENDSTQSRFFVLAMGSDHFREWFRKKSYV